MIESFSAAASALAAQQQRMDALANDTANVNTAGYRSDRTNFEDLAPRARGVRATQQGPSTVQGALQPTGQPLDLAVEGDGWFQVARPGAQPALTRAGVFQVDATGQMVTPAGERLVPPVRLPPGAGATTVRIESDGSVIVGGTRVAQIRLVTVPAPGQLQPVGDGLYAPTAASGPPQPAPAGTAIRQGALESSNVDLVDTTTGTIEARTSFEAAAHVLRVQDEMLGALLDLRSSNNK
ncbi:MAG: flagellar basal-body rod protein FlgG [Thermoleophilaceae bacterium]|nr:flagellar basal-body rod protein FlgG [Thermoleophilaceae bacterium]